MNSNNSLHLAILIPVLISSRFCFIYELNFILPKMYEITIETSLFVTSRYLIECSRTEAGKITLNSNGNECKMRNLEKLI